MPSVQCFCPIHYALVDSIYENKTKYHGLGGFNKESLFLIVLEAGSLRSRRQNSLVVEGARFLVLPHGGEIRGAQVTSFTLKGTKPILGLHLHHLIQN